MKKSRIRIIAPLGVMAALGIGVPAASSLAAVVKGRVVDADKQVLPGTAAQLISFPDTVRKGYVMTNDNGEFQFKDVAPGEYVLLLSMMGMDDIGHNINVADSAANIDLGNLEMSENSITLQEAIVTAVKAAVIAKEDTLEFNADSFRTQKNATVEDLLKKLPGVEVGSDGSITSGGKTIKKILVDGKEFFADDPKVASKNLPSDIVDKVQVVDRKSDAARLTGIDDGDDETVINLTVKKGMNNGWFGNLGAGYGTDGRYEGTFNINYFNNGNQVTLLGGGNNINEMGFSDRGRGRFRDFGGNNGINTSWQTGLNFNVGNDDKFRVGGNVFYTYTDRKAISHTERQYLFPDSVSIQRGSGNTRDKGHNIRADFRMQWNIDEFNTLEFRPNFSYNNRNSSLFSSDSLWAGNPSHDLVNTNLNLQANRGTSYEASGDLLFNHKFGLKGRSMSFQIKYSYADSRQHGTSLSDIEYLLRKEDSEELFRYLDTDEWSNYVEGRATYTEPLGDPANGNFLALSYRFSYRWNNGDRFTYNLPDEMLDALDPLDIRLPQFDAAPSGLDYDPVLSNSFRNKFMNQELQLGYKKNAKDYTLDAGMLFAPSFSLSEDLINPNRSVPKRWVWNVAPYARFRYKFSKTTSLTANYRARTSQPSISALQPVADVTDPLNIKIGNPDLKPTFTQSIRAHFNSFDTESQRSVNAMLNASMALNSVVSRTVTDPQTGGRTTTYANVNGNWSLFGMGMVNSPFRNRHWRYNARLALNYRNNPGYINGDFNRSGDFSVAPAIGITYSIDMLQASLNPTYRFSMATSTLAKQPDRYTHAYGFNTSWQLDLPFGLQVSTDLDFSKSSGYSAGFNATQWLWNAQISYSLLSDKSLTFSVRAYDLLGDKKNISRSVSANLITDSEYNDLTRYVMFGVSWKFNSMSRRAARASEPTDVPPPPEGEHRRGPRGERGDGPPFGGGPGGGGRPF